ncbi:Universal stress protein F [Defluviimonas aquaemixtae]|uniref:Universal stress protein F n=1 Tax=Albidovulum aquaemixtae TaxID=1542388 RepID=A0A2R8BNA4_9RHOB|nr:universal stress protein [Defluviimonas aquaemixtae]SPH24929.1 Universal stress protein F [Defluviimonas aquaemixtae]
MGDKILVPIDLADQKTGLKTIAEGVIQATARKGELIVMTVVPDILSGLDFRYAIRGETGGSEDYDLKAIVKEALEKLNEIVADHIPSGMKVSTIARHGTAYEEILNVARDVGATMIVLGAHRPSLKDYLIGPTAARVVRHAECSVNVLRDM